MDSAWLQFVVGLLLLFGGGELLVRGASAVARLAGLSPLVIGLTVVAYGTSAPELVVSSAAALSGHDDVAVGNVVGSNVFNILFILGVCALAQPLVVARQVVIRDVPILIAASLAMLLLGFDGRIGAMEGLVLCAGAVWFTVDSVRASRRETLAGERGPETRRSGRSWPFHVALVVLGLAILFVGGRAFVAGSVSIAEALGLDETVIALTIVSAGTSLPEVATSIVATLRGERDMAVGNVIGSCIFNIFAILGVASLVSGGGGLAVASSMENFDLPVMTAAAAACLPLMARAHCLARWEGALFLAYYAAYVTYLLLAAEDHAALPRFSAVMLEFVLPLTAATILALAVSRRSPPPSPGATRE